ncbi:MAG: response regulator transcription factor [Acidobacteriota bacterium]
MSAGARILVIDDEVDVARTAALVLKKAGYAVETCHNGPDALARTSLGGLDLILLDINMPGMDGWEVLRVLKADEATASIPVAMFSVRGEIRDKVHGLQEGALDYITKPFSIDELAGRVAAILDQEERGKLEGASR